MPRYIFILICTVAMVHPWMALADEKGEKALVELSQRLREMGSYESNITLKMQSDIIEGQYRISGKNYHIDLGNIEFWGIGDKRYEVSHKIEEVVIEKTDQGDNSILANPTQAFDLVEQGFEIKLLETPSELVLRLSPKAAEDVKIDVDQIVIHLDQKSQLPTKIIYQANDDSVEIEFGGIKKSKSSIKEFNISSYRKYDIIDLY